MNRGIEAIIIVIQLCFLVYVIKQILGGKKWDIFIKGNKLEIWKDIMDY